MPIIWRILGRLRIYALPGATALCTVMGAVWFTLQLHVIPSGTLTAAGKVFLAGFSGLMAMVVIMAIGCAVSVEQTVIHQTNVLEEELQLIRENALLIRNLHRLLAEVHAHILNREQEGEA